MKNGSNNERLMIIHAGGLLCTNKEGRGKKRISPQQITRSDIGGARGPSIAGHKSGSRRLGIQYLTGRSLDSTYPELRQRHL